MSAFTSFHYRAHLRWCVLFLVLFLLPTPGFSSLGSLALRAAPEVVRADGHSTTTITAEVRDSGGDLVPDGTQVHFTTTAGQIEAVVPTVAGRARATFTSDAIAGVAQVSAFSGTSSATISVRMVDDPETLGPAGKVLILDGQYVAYSESIGILEAIGDARLTWKGQRITARAIQVDLMNSVIRAWGGVTVEARGRSRGRGAAASSRETGDNERVGVGVGTGPPTPTPTRERSDPELSPASPAPPQAQSPLSSGQSPDVTPGTDVRENSPDGSDIPSLRGVPGSQQPTDVENTPEEQRPAAEPAKLGSSACGSQCPARDHLHGERIAVDMLSDQATLLTVEARQIFDLPTLTPLTGARAAPDPLEWTDLTDSDMLWKADRVIAVPGQKVQLRKAAAYLGGQRVLQLPYHEVLLEGGISTQGQQYLGVGSYGLMVDLPYYLGMSADASTSLRLRHGSRSGFGWYGTNPGWQFDLERRYGLPGANEGVLTLGRVTSSDWGLHWHHTQRLARGTQAFATVEYPAHRDLYANLNLSRSGRRGNLGLNLSAHKLQQRSLGRTVDFNAQTAPRVLGQTGVKLTLESRLHDSRGGHFVAFNGERYEVEPSHSRELGLRLTPSMLRLGRGGLSTWVSLRQVWGSHDRSGFGLAGSTAFNHPIGQSGGLTLNYSYNRFPGRTFYGWGGRQNLSGSLRLSPTRRLFLAAFGSMGLDSPTRSVSATAAYTMGPLWRIELQQTAYHFRTLSESDLQIGLTRMIGPRELTIYWSRLRHRFMFQIGGGGL